MEDIKVGEYVRTKNGIIIKYEFLKESENFEVFFGQKGKGFTFEDMEEFEDFIKQRIVKHSKNIIDLIEVGDYVNEKKVILDLEKSKKMYNTKDDFVTCKDYTFEENEIKSVVTKEQFDSIKYEV